MEHRKKVLIVDDTPTVVKTLARILKDNYKVVVSTNGNKALEMIKQGNVPDIILCDVIMPEMDGYEFITHIKAMDKTKSLPFIFVTGRDNEQEKQKGLALGANEYIKKPFDAEVIISKIQSLLS